MKLNLRTLSVLYFVVAALGTTNRLSAANFTLQDGTLAADGKLVLQGVPPEFALVPDPGGAGVFLRFTARDSNSFLQTPLGKIAGLKRFTSTHRYEPFWMRAFAGKTEADVQAETQWLLAETESGDCIMLVPLPDGPFRFSLGGSGSGLMLYAETGDPFLPGNGGVGLFVSVGKDPYALCDAGAKAVMGKLGTGKLRRDKPAPDFTDLFGWCTWDAFYQDVSADKVKLGLKAFADGGVDPRFLILDDGWQDVKRMPSGETRLISLNANSKFNGDLTPLTKMAKEEFKVKVLLVWQTMIGYWGGVDGKSLPGYDVREALRSFGPGVLKHEPIMNVQYWGQLAGLVAPDKAAKFFDDYHSRMKAQGVDGVKVDSQSVLEGLGAGLGGRTALFRAYRDALEGSVQKHFNGRLINCMANSMETFYGSPRSTDMRTSTDFWPRRPETHGDHLYINSQVGVWFGEFMQPDWDMFQSGHEMGSFHAAGRAVSGGPVYVSDKVEEHDFALLKKLVLSDGTILRADNVGRPTRDCLFANVLRDPVLLKIFNFNRDCGVIGIFNANYHANAAEKRILEGTVSPSDLPGLAGQEFAAFSQQGNRVWRCKATDREPIKLTEGKWEIVSFAPVDRGVAVLGLADKLNSTGAVMERKWNADGSFNVKLRDGGSLIAWAEKAPLTIESDGKRVEFIGEFKQGVSGGRLFVKLPAAGPQTVVLHW